MDRDEVKIKVLLQLTSSGVDVSLFALALLVAFTHLYRPNEIPDLPITRLCVLSPRPQVKQRHGAPIKPTEHMLPRLSLNLDFIRNNQIRLELPPPLERRLNPFLRIGQIPLCRAHITRIQSSRIEPSFLPAPIAVFLRQSGGVQIAREGFELSELLELLGGVRGAEGDLGVGVRVEDQVRGRGRQGVFASVCLGGLGGCAAQEA